jgi:hypothetical protein
MDKEVVLMAGLPGAGKTTHLSRMLSDGWLVFDDFKAQAFEDCSRFGSSRKFLPLIVALRAGLKCVAADIDFCRTESREEAEGLLRAIIPDVRLCWLFFENDPSACEANVRSRNSPSRETELIKVHDYSAAYEIPHGANILPVRRDPSRSRTDD